MIGLPTGTQVWLAAGVTDMRRGFDGLAALVQTQRAAQPFSGHMFVVRGRRDETSAYRSGFVVVEYPWHPLHGKRVPLFRRTGRWDRGVVHVEVRPGLSRALPNSMVGAAVCAAMSLGPAKSVGHWSGAALARALEAARRSSVRRCHRPRQWLSVLNPLGAVAAGGEGAG